MGAYQDVVCAIINAIFGSYKGQEESGPFHKSNAEIATFVRAANANILCFDKHSPDSHRDITKLALQHLSEIWPIFLWKYRCCMSATDIADMFNTSHLAGIVACKIVHILIQARFTPVFFFRTRPLKMI